MSLFNLLSVSASGMAAQRTRAEILVENMANAETTRTSASGGGPYKRRDVIFESALQQSPFQSVLMSEMGEVSNGVRVSEVIEDGRDPDKRYIPGHPDADVEGYVAFPRMNPAEEMVDLISATRGYQANVSAMSAVKDMIHRSLDILR